MTYVTHLGHGLTVRSTDVRLSRGRIERKHVITGSAHQILIWENRTSLACLLYVDGQFVQSFTSLTKAYEGAIEEAVT